MSRLSERCHEFLVESGSSVYQLSKISGLDRTSLHRLVTGQRIPTLDFLMRFCSVLSLNAADIQELMELFEEARSGPTAFRNRQRIFQILENVADFAENPFPFSESAVSASPYALPASTQTMIQTKMLIFQALENAFSSQGASEEILTNLPLGRMEFLPVIYQFHKKYGKKVRLCHLFYFTANPSLSDSSNPNLEIIRWILPMALADFDSYEPYYTYTKSSSNDMKMLLWPYYLITSRIVIVISAHLDCAVVHLDADTNRIYRQEMLDLLAQSRPLRIHTRSFESSLDFYLQVTQGNGPLLSTLEYQPCVSPLISKELYISQLQKENLSQTDLPLFGKLMNLNPFIQGESSHYFTMQGLRSFCETGRILGQFGTYLDPLSTETRRQVLSRYINDLRRHSHSRIIRSSIRLPATLNIELYRNNFILFILFEKHQRIRFVSISEASLYEVFLDFFQALDGPAYSYSAEETLAALKSALQSL